jgi:hypothetical protein
MRVWNRGLRLGLLAALAALAAAGCGSSSGGDATTLLKQTFGGSHRVNSGNVTLNLTLTPTGSRSSSAPIALSLGGPFQSLGAGKLPQSNFSVSLSAGGQHSTLGILSTGTSGYVTLQGTSYQLPQSTFQRIESSFSGLASSAGSGSGSSALSKLGIHPLNWLIGPTIVGDEDVGGAATTHIRAGINVSGLLTDLNTLIQKASTVGVSAANQLASGLSASTRSQIASEVRNPTVDVWTGKSDKTIRRLSIQLTLSGAGLVANMLGGARTANFGLTMQYANLNQPQTITAPTAVRPYTEFTTRVRTFLQSLQSVGSSSGSGGSVASTTAGASSTGTTGAGTAGGTSKNVSAYSQCIQAAGNDVSKLQRCAPLVNGG